MLKNDTAHDSKDFYLKEIVDAAEHQSVYALTAVGDFCYYGQNGYEKNIEKAYSFWKKVSEIGGITAMYYMSYGYWKGDCGKKDFMLSYMHALQAAEYGYPKAYRLLGFMLQDGQPFTKDYDKALQMYEEAIKRGDYICFCYAGFIYGQKKDYARRRYMNGLCN